MNQTHIAIIGAGASGLMAAYKAADTMQKQGEVVSVTVLEGNVRAGKKLLATGNGRCNLTNTQISAINYHGDSKADEIALRLSAEEVMEEFEKMGILCRQDEAGRVYPHNLQAAAVLKALRSACEEKGVKFLYEYNVFSMLHMADGFLLKSENGHEILADICILASGGQASPKHSCGMNGYALAKQMGHTVTKLAPVLTPVLCKEKVISSIKGMRCKANAVLEGDGIPLYYESGEVIFAEKALSGICIFNISVLVADFMRFGLVKGKKYKNLTIVLDLAENIEEHTLKNYLKQSCQSYPNRDVGDLLNGVINMKIGEELLKSLKFNRSRPFSSLTNAEIELIVKTLKAWRFSVSGLGDWEKAQVTAGGVPLSEIQTHTMQSSKMQGFYLTGEVLDVHGDCGGFNLHFAWVSGLLAGKAAAKNIIII
ncbi:NAD(P)/FAD-dependent oxidoreductase [Scatolibacter rhodanostii]|uniref:NAD(P)/FAD-dependent oxidoreductase n=1 Tax=Scatolibacter rhodanostii TaxID=2014781 RepID=UPI000C07A9D9|nr:aminoacetone oxidase family FAD-binding enzyme [Scatolibacter rhodanostii]